MVVELLFFFYQSSHARFEIEIKFFLSRNYIFRKFLLAVSLPSLCRLIILYNSNIKFYEFARVTIITVVLSDSGGVLSLTRREAFQVTE